MPAKLIPDMHQGPGHGIIIVQPFECQSPPVYALYRSSDKLCLDKEGWQSSEVFLEPAAWDCHENVVRLAVNPSVINNLDKLDTYKIIIKDGENEQSFTLLIEDMIQSTMDGGFGVGLAAAPVAQEIVRNTVEESAPLVPPAPVVEEPPVQPEPEAPKPQVDSLSLDAQSGEEKKKGSKLIPLLLLFLLLLAASVGAFLWYLHKQTEDPQKSPIEQATEKDKNSNTAKDKAKDDDSKVTLVPIDAARALLRKNASGEESHALAQQLEKQGKDEAATQDAIFLLIEDAAQKGLPSAMMQLGSFYDPSLRKMYGSVPVDIEQAYTWYTKALQDGESKAKASLDSLRTWAQNAAKNGDSSAQNLLEKWQ